MAKIIVTEFITLDGVIHAPNEWSFPYWNDEIADFKNKEIKDVGAMLLGRVTYEGFAAAWPGRTDEAGYADKFNSMPKYVVSTTMEKADWNNSKIINENIFDEIRKLKKESKDDIIIFGSGKLIKSLIKNDLIDQYQLLVYPLVIGKGNRLFDEESNAKLKLLESKQYTTGVVLLKYETLGESSK